MIKSKLELLMEYCHENMPSQFNLVIENYACDLNLNTVINHINKFYKGFEKDCMIVVIKSIHQEELAYNEAEMFLNA